ncbi:MAG TPA: ArsR family transcriptional regulator [Candidatus Pacearchaeota archaeon]|nr:ArsR family transcriptional regulator [Candidatus Pacearchaeota archaeon]
MTEKPSKSIQKSIRGLNLDFSIFQQIVKGSWPAKIAKDFDMSPTRIDYHISSLKERNLIEMKSQGNWIALKNYEPKPSKKSIRVATEQPAEYLDAFDPDTIRGHGYQFKLKLPKDIRNWTNEGREKVLRKLKISYIPLKLFGGGQRIIFRKKKVHLTNKSIIIYDRASYYTENAIRAQGLALIKILYLVKALEQRLQARNYFSIKGKYMLKVTRQHHALIKNALAIIYNKPVRKKLEVSDEKGQWLLIDNSWNLNELECIHPETSVPDADGMRKVMNSFKKTDFHITSEYIIENFWELQGMMKKSSETQMMTGQVMQQMEKNLIHLTKIVMKGGDKNAD